MTNPGTDSAPEHEGTDAHDPETQEDTNSGGAPEQPDENVTSGDTGSGS